MSQHSPIGPADISENAASVHRESIVIDALAGSLISPTPPPVNGHDYIDVHRRAGVTAVNVCLASEPNYTPDLHTALQRINDNLAMLEAYSGRLVHVLSASDIERAKSEGKLGVIFGCQSASILMGDIAMMPIFHRLGLRILQLTYSERNQLGDGCYEKNELGLTEFGAQVVNECNRLGVLVDLSHVGKRTSLEAIEASTRPCAFTHANAQTLTDNPRNMTDEQIRAVSAKGGVIGCVPYSPLCALESGTQPSLQTDFMRHVDYIVNLAGIDHVGVGTDIFAGRSRVIWESQSGRKYFPGKAPSFRYDQRHLVDFPDHSAFPRLTEALLRQGYSDEDTRKILGGNFMRLFKEVWGA
jgi:membrane dipeptidase